MVSYMLDKMEFQKSFDGIFASAHLGHKKPDLEFFIQVMTKLPNIQKDELLFWDDTQINVDAANVFGINAELYSSFPDFQQKMQNYV